jgi:hypothetical protein
VCHVRLRLCAFYVGPMARTVNGGMA